MQLLLRRHGACPLQASSKFQSGRVFSPSPSSLWERCVCVRALTVCSHLLLLTAPPKSLAHVPSALSRAGHRPRLASPITISPNWVLSYLHIWLLWDHGWGRVGGSPPPPSNPQARPCASPPVESLGPKSALCFYSYFVWICKIAKFWSLPCGVWLESSVYNKVLLP